MSSSENSQGGNCTTGTKVATGKFKVTLPVAVTKRYSIVALPTGSVDITVTFEYDSSYSADEFKIDVRSGGNLLDGSGNVFYVFFGA